MQLIVIALGGASGALLRYWVSSGVYAWLGRGFPYGTLAVNVMGSLAIGYLSIFLIERLNLSSEWRSAVIVGFLGAFTTFSTFSLETLSLIEEGEITRAMLNILLSVILCIAAAWIGIWLARNV